MANTLTSLIPDLYESLDVVSREFVGMIPAVTRDPSIARAALNENVRVFQSATATASDVTPGQLPPDDGDQTFGNMTCTISKSRVVPFRWTGEEQMGVNHGPGYAPMRLAQMTQAFRTLANEIEADLAGLHTTASRAYGTAGTTPFASDLSDTAQIRKIMSDNGSPMGDLQLVFDTTAGAKVRTLTNLTKANEAGSTDLLRRGVLLDIHGYALRESAQIKTPTKGTGTGYLVNNGPGYAVGATTIALDTGSGTILAGDIVTFAGDTNKYVVATALSGGNIVLAAPGLRQTLADNVALTVGNTATRNFAFDRGAVLLATRMPALPDENDMADDRTTITDPVSGISFEVAMYRQYRRVRYEVCLAWGVANVKPAHTAILLG